MPKLNENYLQLKESYLFSEIAHRTAAYSEKHPDKVIQETSPSFSVTTM